MFLDHATVFSVCWYVVKSQSYTYLKVFFFLFTWFSHKSIRSSRKKHTASESTSLCEKNDVSYVLLSLWAECWVLWYKWGDGRKTLSKFPTPEHDLQHHFLEIYWFSEQEIPFTLSNYESPAHFKYLDIFWDALLKQLPLWNQDILLPKFLTVIGCCIFSKWQQMFTIPKLFTWHYSQILYNMHIDSRSKFSQESNGTKIVKIFLWAEGWVLW